MQPVIAVYSGQAEDGWIVWCKSLFCSCVLPNTQQGNAVPPQTWTAFRHTVCPFCFFVPISLPHSGSHQAGASHKHVHSTEMLHTVMTDWTHWQVDVIVSRLVFIVWTDGKSMLGLLGGYFMKGLGMWVVMYFSILRCWLGLTLMLDDACRGEIFFWWHIGMRNWVILSPPLSVHRTTAHWVAAS